ncbi:MAG: Hpt domain-containing protein, partial [Cyanobacteria bacterium J06623_4]
MTATQDWHDLSLMGLFRLEVETQVAVLNEHLLTLEKQMSNEGTGDAPQTNASLTNSGRLDTLMRAAHSIKGAARIVQIEPVVKVAHALEDCFMVAQQGILQLKSDHVDVLLLAIDFIARLSLIEESALAEQAAVYEDDANTIVLSIEAVVAAALKDESLDRFSDAEPPAKEVPVKTVAPKKKIAPQKATSVAKTDENAAVDFQLTSTATAETVLQEATSGSSEVVVRTASERSERMIRMSADNLNRLMGLAGESLVESNWLQPFATSLLNLKQQQQSVLSLLQRL